MNNVAQNYFSILLFQRLKQKNPLFIRLSSDLGAFHPKIDDFLFTQMAIRPEFGWLNWCNSRFFSLFGTFVNMKKAIKAFFFISTIGFLSLGTTACSKKTGCPMNETVHAKTGKDGSYSKKRGKSALFPKNMKKN